MIYYARPYSYNPFLARIKYYEESSKLHDVTGEMIICTIPLTNYEHITLEEQVVFDLAETMIKESDMLVWKGNSKGVKKEIALAKKYEVPIKEYKEIVLWLKI